MTEQLLVDSRRATRRSENGIRSMLRHGWMTPPLRGRVLDAHGRCLDMFATTQERG